MSVPISPVTGRKYSFAHSRVRKVHPSYSLHHDMSTPLPASVSLLQWMPPLYDQAQEGSCTAFGAKNTREFLSIKYVKKPVPLSAQFQYYCERLLNGDVPQDAGSTVATAMVSMQMWGIAPDADEPYSTPFATHPSAKSFVDAAHYKVGKVYALNTLLDMKNALNSGFVFELGFLVYESFETASVAANGIMTMPKSSESLLGGHATCLTGDTGISLLDGTERPIVELCRDFEDKPFWVYSCDENGNVVPGLAHHPRKTGEIKPIVKVTLDNGETIRCTSDERFMVRDGSYQEASSLAAGDSLTPLYRKIDEKQLPGYEMVYNPSTQRWRYTHRAAYSGAYGKYNGGVIHHDDFNKCNNTPDNLIHMTWEKHTALHNHYTRLLKDYAQSDEGRECSRQLMTKLWSDPTWREESMQRLSENGKNVSRQLMLEGRCGFQAMDKGTLAATGRITGQVNILKAQTPEARNKMATTLKLRYATDLEFAKAVLEKALKASQVAAILPPTQLQIEARRENAKIARIAKAEKFAMAAANNHKVVSVEDAGYEDVYDLTVDKYHNFALTSGVFVHNCVWGYNDKFAFPGLPPGALCIRNSWGSWGNNGNCFMPYGYLNGIDPSGNGPYVSDCHMCHLGPVWS